MKKAFKFGCGGIVALILLIVIVTSLRGEDTNE